MCGDYDGKMTQDPHSVTAKSHYFIKNKHLCSAITVIERAQSGVYQTRDRHGCWRWTGFFIDSPPHMDYVG